MTVIDKSAIRNAATLIVVRDRLEVPKVLMGQRGANAAFMPNKFVFPGGAVDAQDRAVVLQGALPEPCHSRLDDNGEPGLQNALAAAAIRELWEETGLILGVPGDWPGAPPPDWRTFAATGCLPCASAMQFVFRALTPPGRSRRFDARFFLVDAAHIQGDLDDFTHATDELSHLQWIALSDARRFDLPFITEVVLAEIAQQLHTDDAPESVPYFRNNDEESLFLRLRGHKLPYPDD